MAFFYDKIDHTSLYTTAAFNDTLDVSICFHFNRNGQIMRQSKMHTIIIYKVVIGLFEILLTLTHHFIPLQKPCVSTLFLEPNQCNSISSRSNTLDLTPQL